MIGAGGFGRESLDVVEAINNRACHPEFELVGVLDDSPSAVNLERLHARHISHLGHVAQWIERGGDADFVVAVGDPVRRRELTHQFEVAGYEAATLLHPRATVGSQGTIGPGTVVCAAVRISTNVMVGRHAHLNPGVTIGHDSSIGDFVSINPTATVSGDCAINRDVLIGASAVVLQGLTIGAGAVVGAAACVVSNIPPGVTVKGIPAR